MIYPLGQHSRSYVSRGFTILTILIILTMTLFLNAEMVNAGGGTPEIQVSAELTPSSIIRGETSDITVTIKEVKGEDWAKNVTITVTLSVGTFSNDENIISKNYDKIDTLGSKTFSDTINIPVSSDLGSHTVSIDVVYYDTGLLDLGTFGPYTAEGSTTFTVLNSPPTAGFTHSPTQPTIEDTITFTDKSSDDDGTIESWSWDFGDGTTSTDQNPTHKYDEKDNYLVTLTVTDNDGATASKNTTINMKNLAPTANFTYTPSNPSIKDSITFVSDGSSDPDGEIVSWSWSFGDGTTSDEQNPTHTYNSKETFTVKLTVTDNDGDTNSCETTITVINLPPTADFSCSTKTPLIGETIVFTDKSSDDDGSIKSWTWDFGDGTTSTEQNPTYSYSEKGTYEVKLTVEDDDGEKGLKIVTIAVGNKPPVADFEYYPLTPSIDEDISFTDLSKDDDGTVSSWLWKFGDGTTSTDQNPTHKYSEPGQYTIELTVTDNDGSTNTVPKTITIYEPEAQQQIDSQPQPETGDQKLPTAVLPTELLIVIGGGATIGVIALIVLRSRRKPPPRKKEVFIKCPYCKATIPIDSEKCPICGAKMEQ